MSAPPPHKPSFWTTMPGILTGVGTLVLALTSVVGALVAAGVIGGDDSGPSPTPAPVAAEDLAMATVQILAAKGAGNAAEIVWTGSGSVVSKDGLILTAGHLVDNRNGEYDRLEIAITERTDEPPERKYIAEIAAVDYVLDLAVIKIVSDLEGNPELNLHLPFVEVGVSDDVKIGDKIRILGYPGTGGETITSTEGSVSGFTSERNIGGRAWIKTDANISGGSSGGMAVNESGQLIAVPLILGSGSEEGEFVDCRKVADTNADGVIDELDTCVPVGGFINGLRPVNLAKELIEYAQMDFPQSGTPYVVEPPEPEPSGGYDLSKIIFQNLLFSDGVTADDQPTQVLAAFPSGVTKVCAFWDYQGMVTGMAWDAQWYIDGKLDEGGSILDDTWDGEESGNWWACIINENGLADGLYELVLSVEGETQLSDAVFVEGDHSPREFSLVNAFSATVCFAFLSPSGATKWGQDDLSAEETIDPGQTHVFQLPAGIYDMLLEDCDGQTLTDQRGLDVTEGFTFTLTDNEVQ